MPIHRPTWYKLASRNNIPGLPCPQCVTGKLKELKNGLTIIEPKYSDDYRQDTSWEPENVVYRWSATLRCDEKMCGEIVHMIGDTEVVETLASLPGGEEAWGYEDALRIQAVFPAPPLFRISANVPRKVKAQLQIAFRMYWTDTSACVARLRTAVEALLNHQKVPKDRLIKNGKSKGKMRRLDLRERIAAFTSGAVHAGQLDGLRNIGNLGTHGTDDVEDDDLFDAVDVLEFVLTGIYDTQTINAKAAKLKQKKAKS